MSEHSTEQDPAPKPKKAFSLTKGAILTIAVGIEATYQKEGRKVPEKRELMRLAWEKYRSSIDNGSDNHLGTAAPLN